MRRLLVPLLLVTTAAVAPGADAAPAYGRIVLRGSAPVAAEIHLPAGLKASNLRITTRGRYAVALLTELSTADSKAVGLLVPESGDDGMAYTTSRVLPAGRYRLTLVTDGASEVSLALGAGSPRVLRGDRPVTASVAVDGLQPGRWLRAPFTATGRQIGLFAVVTDAAVANAEHYDLCATRANGTCFDAGAEVYGGEGPQVETGKSYVYGVVGIGVPAGPRYDLLLQYAGAGAVYRNAGLAAVITV